MWNVLLYSHLCQQVHSLRLHLNQRSHLSVDATLNKRFHRHFTFIPISAWHFFFKLKKIRLSSCGKMEKRVGKNFINSIDCVRWMEKLWPWWWHRCTETWFSFIQSQMHLSINTFNDEENVQWEFEKEKKTEEKKIQLINKAFV